MTAPCNRTAGWLSGIAGCVICWTAAGCNGNFWSPSPPPPSAEQRVSLRRAAAARQEAARQATRPPVEAAATPPGAPGNLPPLRAYGDWSPAETAADSLGRIGATAVPRLLESLRSPNPQLRWQATRVLGRIGPDAATAVPELVRLLNDEDPRVRLAAARALGQIGPNAASSVPALIRMLEESAGNP